MYLYMNIVFTVSQCHADVHSVYLVFLFDTTILSESMSMSNMFWWDLRSSKSKIKPSNFTLLIVYLRGVIEKFVSFYDTEKSTDFK